MKHPLQAPFTDALPAPLFLRTTLMPDDAIYPTHTHAWGECVYSFQGVVEVSADGQHYLVPPQYGVWLPPHLPHEGLNHLEALQSSFYVSNELCSNMPSAPKALLVSPFMRSLLYHAREGARDFKNEKYLRLLYVLLDELEETPSVCNFLPASEDAALGKVLRHLERYPEDSRSVADIAHGFNATERTLARRCRHDLGMTLSEWRNRMRIVKAIAMFEDGKAVESIALEFGYSSSSAFISMFKRLTKTTPTRYREKM
jgi:AraC-like DNA-binding protein